MKTNFSSTPFEISNSVNAMQRKTADAPISNLLGAALYLCLCSVPWFDTAGWLLALRRALLHRVQPSHVQTSMQCSRLGTQFSHCGVGRTTQFLFLSFYPFSPATSNTSTLPSFFTFHFSPRISHDHDHNHIALGLEVEICKVSPICLFKATKLFLWKLLILESFSERSQSSQFVKLFVSFVTRLLKMNLEIHVSPHAMSQMPYFHPLSPIKSRLAQFTASALLIDSPRPWERSQIPPLNLPTSFKTTRFRNPVNHAVPFPYRYLSLRVPPILSADRVWTVSNYKISICLQK